MRRDPWLFPEPIPSHLRAAVRGRYVILPYLYTQMRVAHLTLDPVMRPIFYNFPTQTRYYAEQDAFMVGESLLVRPVLEYGQRVVRTPLPEGQVWYNFKTGEEVVGENGYADVEATMEYIPVLLKGGSVLPVRYGEMLSGGNGYVGPS